MKKIIKIFIWIIVISLIAFGIYWFFFVKNNPGAESPSINSLKSLFPFGLNDNSSTSNSTDSSGTNNNNSSSSSTSTQPYRLLVQLSKRPVIGMTVISTPVYTELPALPSASGATNTSVLNDVPLSAGYRSSIFSKTNLPIVRFAEHGTGYIYDVDARAQNETKQTGTTIVRAAQAYFGDYGNGVIFRYIKNDNSTIETYLGKIIAPKNDNTGQYATIKGDFLPENISDIAVSSDGKKVNYIVPIDGGVDGVSLNIDGTNKSKYFSSSFDEWLLDLKQGLLTVTTKPSSGIPGFSYFVQPGGAMQKIIGGVVGLTTNISPDGKMLLYASAQKAKIDLFVRRSNNDSTKLEISTLPEKCVWGKNSQVIYCSVPNYIPTGIFPDDWYQGVAHFHDSLWRVNANTGVSVKISDFEDSDIDAVNLVLDSKENFIFFKNKNDGTPWSLDLKTNPASVTTTISSPFPSLDTTKTQ